MVPAALYVLSYWSGLMLVALVAVVYGTMLLRAGTNVVPAVVASSTREPSSQPVLVLLVSREEEAAVLRETSIVPVIAEDTAQGTTALRAILDNQQLAAETGQLPPAVIVDLRRQD